MLAFRVVTPCGLVSGTNVSEEHASTTFSRGGVTTHKDTFLAAMNPKSQCSDLQECKEVLSST